MKVKHCIVTLLVLFMAVAMKAEGELSPLRVMGKHLVDDNGKAVTLHGVMDTPNRYFNGWR